MWKRQQMVRDLGVWGDLEKISTMTDIKGEAKISEDKAQAAVQQVEPEGCLLAVAQEEELEETQGQQSQRYGDKLGRHSDVQATPKRRRV